MSVVLSIVLWLLAFVCLVVVLAVVLPLRLELEVHKKAEWRVVAAIRLFGRYGPRIPIKKGPPRPKIEKPHKEKSRKKRRSSSRDPRALASAGLRFVIDLLGCIRVGRLNVHAHFGLGDPAMTGEAFGMLSPLMYAAPAFPGVQVHVVPDFDRTVLTGAADIAFSVVPIRLFGPVIRLGWHLFGPVR